MDLYVENTGELPVGDLSINIQDGSSSRSPTMTWLDNRPWIEDERQNPLVDRDEEPVQDEPVFALSK